MEAACHINWYSTLLLWLLLTVPHPLLLLVMSAADCRIDRSRSVACAVVARIESSVQLRDELEPDGYVVTSVMALDLNVVTSCIK